MAIFCRDCDIDIDMINISPIISHFKKSPIPTSLPAMQDEFYKQQFWECTCYWKFGTRETSEIMPHPYSQKGAWSFYSSGAAHRIELFGCRPMTLYLQNLERPNVFVTSSLWTHACIFGMFCGTYQKNYVLVLYWWAAEMTKSGRGRSWSELQVECNNGNAVNRVTT